MNKQRPSRGTSRTAARVRGQNADKVTLVVKMKNKHVHLGFWSGSTTQNKAHSLDTDFLMAEIKGLTSAGWRT